MPIRTGDSYRECDSVKTRSNRFSKDIQAPGPRTAAIILDLYILHTPGGSLPQATSTYVLTVKIEKQKRFDIRYPTSTFHAWKI